MQFDTLLDMTYKFRELELSEVQELLSFVLKVTYGVHDFLYWHEYEPETNQEGISFSQRRTYLSIKRTIDDNRYQIDRYIRAQDLPLMETKSQHLCIAPQCWNESAQSKHKFTLFYRSGEEIYITYDLCEHHLEPADKHIVATIQMKDLGDEDHTHIASWQSKEDLGWYSQHTWDATDGDYESGYFDYTAASPWLGPFETRTLAVLAAQNWEEE